LGEHRTLKSKLTPEIKILARPKIEKGEKPRQSRTSKEKPNEKVMLLHTNNSTLKALITSKSKGRGDLRGVNGIHEEE